jgi:hypothetical protein
MNTVFCDIDGVIFRHHGKGMVGQLTIDPVLLDGVQNAFNKWDKEGYFIVLTTGRSESSRELTIKQLQQFGLFWDVLIMGLPRGKRIVINDTKPETSEETTQGITIKRNAGLGNINI